jgi:hypothetical protein
MAKKAKTVGQLLSALVGAVKEVDVAGHVIILPTREGYEVQAVVFGKVWPGRGPKLYGAIRDAGAAFIASRSTTALDKLKGRVGEPSAPQMPTTEEDDDTDDND